MTQHSIIWIDREREPKCDPNPEFPLGVDVDFSNGTKVATCKVSLPYPAKRCGVYVIECQVCGLRMACTTAGRTDDPRSATIPCRIKNAQPA